MTDSTRDRKIEHIRIIELDQDVDRQQFYFDQIRLIHRALPEINFNEIDPSIEFVGKRLKFPLLISSMTGGDHEVNRIVNRNLAIAAEATGVAMGVGSQRVMFSHPESRDSFALRSQAPSTLLFANLGAVQLNTGFGIDECRAAVETVGADGLYLHLNPLQEAVQPEGDTNFAGLSDRIRMVADKLDVPVLIKEVGAGISLADAQLIRDAGVHYIDVAGSGGLSWSRIENHRRRAQSPDNLGLVFQDWGIPTPTALQVLAPLRPAITLIASGGIRTGMDMAKALVLGATACGLASPFLRPAMDSPEAVIAQIERLQREFCTALFLLGAHSSGDIIGNSELLLHP